jgi:hypothetical protein
MFSDPLSEAEQGSESWASSKIHQRFDCRFCYFMAHGYYHTIFLASEMAAILLL